jgi:hypothetical protein
MSSGTQVDLDWAGTDSAASGGAGESSAAGATNGGAGYLTDEEILGIEPLTGSQESSAQRSVIPSEARNLSSIEDAGSTTPQRDSSAKDGPRNDIQGGNATFAGESAQMPSWMRAAAADPAHGGEAQALWREHSEFRAAFASPGEARAAAEEVRAIKELLPGGVKDVVSLREATQSVERIDAALFSGDARAQSEVVAELARANPVAFRSLFAEAARVLAGMGQGGEAGGRRQEHSRAIMLAEMLVRESQRKTAGKMPALRRQGLAAMTSHEVRTTLRGNSGWANHKSRITNPVPSTPPLTPHLSAPRTTP